LDQISGNQDAEIPEIIRPTFQIGQITVPGQSLGTRKLTKGTIPCPVRRIPENNNPVPSRRLKQQVTREGFSRAHDAPALYIPGPGMEIFKTQNAEFRTQK
jgi:hypothetical protein